MEERGRGWMDRGERRREGVFQDHMFCRGFGQTLVILEGYQCATAQKDDIKACVEHNAILDIQMGRVSATSCRCICRQVWPFGSQTRLKSVRRLTRGCENQP